ncbi:hypothetical protein B1L04_23960 [Microcystis aeruginosa KW]|uniref:Addiction module toxin, HicA family n=1 Tax=Microcystis aeruginosa KW TaxID=1960155 RepID=A0A1V4BNW3_MICAE|nr:type II toxin-antitoxin system HicA family toxin [Microcystis aeruginosa]OPF15539.1 hypothetical protein B1L04_23960 [Microcystis aeruginosa KW]
MLGKAWFVSHSSAYRYIIVVPIHGNRDLPIGTLKGILKDAGLNEDDIMILGASHLCK